MTENKAGLGHLELQNVPPADIPLVRDQAAACTSPEEQRQPVSCCAWVPYWQLKGKQGLGSVRGSVTGSVTPRTCA